MFDFLNGFMVAIRDQGNQGIQQAFNTSRVCVITDQRFQCENPKTEKQSVNNFFISPQFSFSLFLLLYKIIYISMRHRVYIHSSPREVLLRYLCLRRKPSNFFLSCLPKNYVQVCACVYELYWSPLEALKLRADNSHTNTARASRIDVDQPTHLCSNSSSLIAAISVHLYAIRTSCC